MKKLHRKCHAEGGNISAQELSRGNPNGILKGKSPSESLSVGAPQAVRGKFAKGGHALNTGEQRLEAARHRDDVLGEPAFAKGGVVYKRMKSLYKALHGHFEQEPYMKKLKVRQADVDEGEPHHESRSEMKRASGGRMWIKGAIKHPGALHKQLGISSGKKIPLNRLKKAEQSESPTLRKRAHLAETLRKFR